MDEGDDRAQATWRPPTDDPIARLDELVRHFGDESRHQPALEEMTPDTPSPESESPPPPEAIGALEALIAEIDAESATRSRPTGPIQPATVTAGERTVVFTLAKTRYGFAAESVVEVGTVPPVTLLPHVPACVRGVTSLRGDILAVIDLRLLLGLPKPAPTAAERLLVVRESTLDVTAGLVVDSVQGMARLAGGPLGAPTPSIESQITPFLRGVTELDGRLLVLLDPSALLRAPILSSLREA